MRDDKGSTSAQLVAFARAIGDLTPRVSGFRDPTAAQFLAQPFRAFYEIARRGVWQPINQALGDYRGVVIVNQFRSVLLDRAIDAAKPSQLVILGAGLDGRAWRLSALRECDVYEVDHPSTQVWKRKCAIKLPIVARTLNFVPADLEQDDLGVALERARHVASTPSFWLCEGVVYYLSHETIETVMKVLSARSVQGSMLAVTYMSKVDDKTLGNKLLAAVGEPLRTGFSPDEWSRLAQSMGWTTLSDTGIQEWRAELAPEAKLTRLIVGMQWYERLWIGRFGG